MSNAKVRARRRRRKQKSSLRTLAECFEELGFKVRMISGRVSPRRVKLSEDPRHEAYGPGWEDITPP